MVLTMSSILRILRTVSVERVMALTETRSGCTTSSSSMRVIVPLRTFMPITVSPLAWRLRSSVTVAIGLRPAFSASVDGITWGAKHSWIQEFRRILESSLCCDGWRARLNNVELSVFFFLCSSCHETVLCQKYWFWMIFYLWRHAVFMTAYSLMCFSEGKDLKI